MHLAVDLAVGSETTRFRVGALMPGAVVNARIHVVNRGRDDLRYAMTTSTTNSDGKGLAHELVLTIRARGGDCGTLQGATLYDGPLAAAAFGSATPGPDHGDRTLARGASETLCLRATLPLSAGNRVQGAATTVTFMLLAEATES